MKTITRDKKSFYFDPSAAPAAVVDPGETFVILTTDCYDAQITCDNMEYTLLDTDRINPVTGPVYVNGAEPGDVLKVEILSLQPGEYGFMRVREGRGCYEVKGAHCRRFAIRDGFIDLDGIKLKTEPMLGVIGTAPLTACDTYSPGEHGGNMDIRNVAAGSAVYLPVAVPGALLAMGDCHALMGDGETCICGMETCADVTLRVSVLKNRPDIPTPFIENETHVYTTFAAETLDGSYKGAAVKMQRYVMARTGLSDAQSAMLLSLVGNLRISQVVNPKKGCIMELEKKHLTN